MLNGLVLIGSTQAESAEKVFSLHHSTAPLNLLFQKELTQTECETLATAYVDPIKNEQKNFELIVYDIQHTDPNYREQFAHYIEIQDWVNERQLIQKCILPLMYILGLQDGFINSLDYKKYLLDAGLQQWQIHVLDKARHVPQLDNPHFCAKVIADFVRKTQ